MILVFLVTSYSQGAQKTCRLWCAQSKLYRQCADDEPLPCSLPSVFTEARLGASHSLVHIYFSLFPATMMHAQCSPVLPQRK